MLDLIKPTLFITTLSWDLLHWDKLHGLQLVISISKPDVNSVQNNIPELFENWYMVRNIHDNKSLMNLQWFLARKLKVGLNNIPYILPDIFQET